MNVGSIATRYSRALFEEARKAEVDRYVYDRLCMLYDSMNAVPEVQSALISPRIRVDQKLKLLLIGSGLEMKASNLKEVVRNLISFFKGEASADAQSAKQEEEHGEDLYKRFLWLVLKHERENLMRVIILVYRDLYRDYHQIDHVLFETAVEIPKSLQEKVKEKVKEKTGREVELETRVRPEFIGGFIILIGDRMYDYSYRTKLQNIRKALWNK